MTLPLRRVSSDVRRVTHRIAFDQLSESTLQTARIQEERRRALYLASYGKEYPYSYPGAPFPRDSEQEVRSA